MKTALPYIVWAFGVVLTVVILGALLRFLWGWRKVVLFCALALVFLMSLGLFVALVWRATEWWLNVIPRFWTWWIGPVGGILGIVSFFRGC
jgi:hypothetical protein